MKTMKPYFVGNNIYYNPREASKCLICGKIPQKILLHYKTILMHECSLLDIRIIPSPFPKANGSFPGLKNQVI